MEEDLVEQPFPKLSAEAVGVAELFVRKVKAKWTGVAHVSQEERLEETVEEIMQTVLTKPDENVPLAVRNRLANDEAYYATVLRDVKILASQLYPISYLLYGGDFEDINMLSHNRWRVVSKGAPLLLKGGFKSAREARELFTRVLSLEGVTGQKGGPTQQQPIVEATVGAVIRVCVAISPALSGNVEIAGAIRVPHASKFTSLNDLVANQTMPQGVADFLKACVMGNVNILVAGGTSTGKTTLLRVLLTEAPRHQHVVSIEDSAELNLGGMRPDGRRWVDVVTSLATVPATGIDGEDFISMRTLVRRSLRLKPDRIILGESRGAEMADVVNALQTGHDGSMSTIHGNSAEEALLQAASYAQFHESYKGNPQGAKEAVFRAFHLVIHLGEHGGRRRITGVAALGPGTNISSIYETDQSSGGLKRSIPNIEDLHRIKERIRPFLPNRSGEVPRP